MRFRFAGLVVSLLVIVPLLAAVPPAAPGRAASATDSFDRTWARTDQPVEEGRVTRTWMWGPQANTAPIQEPYAESPDGMRTVQYFDKSRMEITHPDAVDDGLWYVTNGLLVVELVTGQMQTGDDRFEERAPAQVNVAGDPDDMQGPTYASFTALLDRRPANEPDVITEVVARDGTVTTDLSKAAYGIGIGIVTTETRHGIAAPFWSFMNSTGMIYQDGTYTTDKLFRTPYYATGLPITEAYWASVKVAGTYTDVLMQCFERRCLTYTPENPPEWQVEAGNVGQHYYRWRTTEDVGQMADEAAGIVAAIVEGSLWEAVQATEDALALTGVPTAKDGQTYRAAVAPYSITRATPRETLLMAQEARNKAGISRLTLAELGELLQEAGWPFLEGSPPGEQLVRFISTWHEGALAEQDDPYNFAPFFLVEMGRRQVPPVDLASGTADPNDVRLTLLEMRIIASSIERSDTEVASAALEAAQQPAVVPQPCTDLRRDLEFWGEPAHSAVNLARREAIKRAMLDAGFSATDAKEFSKMLSSLRIVDRLQRLAMLYDHASMSITALSENPIHKPTAPQKEYAGFQAKVGVDEEEWSKFIAERDFFRLANESTLVDCFNQLGLPATPDLASFAGEVTGWRVGWSVIQGAPEHAVIEADLSEFDFIVGFRHNVTLTSDHTAETKPMLIQLDQELESDHPGPERTSQVVVKAELDTAAPPSLWTFINAGLGTTGAVSSIAELLDGWYRKMTKPVVYTTLDVTYHQAQKLTLTVQTESAASDCAPAMSNMSTLEAYIPVDVTTLTNGQQVTIPIEGGIGRGDVTRGTCISHHRREYEPCNITWDKVWVKGEETIIMTVVDAERGIVEFGIAEPNYQDQSGWSYSGPCLPYISGGLNGGRPPGAVFEGLQEIHAQIQVPTGDVPMTKTFASADGSDIWTISIE